jgi:actin related protein 2/3 complex subunit 1A/1B
MLAFCPNNTEIHLWKFDGSAFEPVTVLREHDEIVTSLAWGHRTNRLVSCSQDRNAFVWQQDTTGKWTPMLVYLRTNRAAIQVKWSPTEERFAVATGQKMVCVCYFDEEQNFWVSKRTQEFDSSVQTVDWHPNGALLAAGGTDSKVRLLSGVIKGIDKKPPKMFGAEKAHKALSLVAEITAGGWVHDVAFSPSGDSLAFVSHDAVLGVIALPADRVPEAGDVTKVHLKGLAMTRLVWLDDSTIVAAGHDPNPRTFKRTAQGWTMGKALDDPSTRAAAKKRGSVVSDAFKMFESRSSQGQDAPAAKSVTTIHQNAVTDIYPMSQTTPITKFSTVALDGRLVVWDMPTIEKQLGGLTL